MATPSIRITSSIGDILEDSSIDIIDVCLPPQLHFPTTVRSLEAGKHVICEKPIVLSLDQMDRLETAVQEHGRRVFPVFQYRYGRGIEQLRALQNAGLAGKAYVASIETHWNRGMEYYGCSLAGHIRRVNPVVRSSSTQSTCMTYCPLSWDRSPKSSQWPIHGSMTSKPRIVRHSRSEWRTEHLRQVQSRSEPATTLRDCAFASKASRPKADQLPMHRPRTIGASAHARVLTSLKSRRSSPRFMPEHAGYTGFLAAGRERDRW